MNGYDNRFKLSPRGVMLALVSAALSESALANTGRVDFAIGNVTVTQNGRARALLKGAELGSGDKITSGADGRAQIRFSDGAYVAVQPNTEFEIKQYRFNGKTDGSESALFGLFKGALRTVTGLVGRVNRNKYQITTPTATIGIRGTGGLIQVNNDGSTLVAGSSGIWSLTNNGGTIDVPAGSAGFAGTNRNAPPRLTTGGPVVPPPQPQTGPLPPTFVQGDVVGPLGNPIVPTSGPGYAVQFFGVGAFFPATSDIFNPANAVFDTAGRLTQFDGLNVQGAPTTYTLAGTQVDTGTDGFLSWGRWVDNVTVTTPTGSSTFNLKTSEGFHYVTGIPTPAASMPTSGAFTYNLIGATSPTFGDGSAPAGVLNSATLKGDFALRSGFSVSLSATAGGTTFTALNAPLTLGTNTFFSNTSSVTSTTGTAYSCCVSCGLSVSGFFSGVGATHAGMTYNITGTGSTNLVGAAALAR
jgi:hypothetical protein